MDEKEIREKRKQGVRLRARDDGPPKVIQAGCDPLPGQCVVLVWDARTADEARRVYASYLAAKAYKEADLKALRKSAPQVFLDLMDGLDRVHVEAWTEEVEDGKAHIVKRKEAKRG